MSIDDPQLEDGFTPVANSIMEALARTQLSGYEWRVLLFLLRKTYGWSKKSDRIALSQFVDGTGINQRRVIEAINDLIAKNIIHKTSAEIRTSKGREYAFNKHYGSWTLVRKSAVRKSASAEKRTSLVRKSADTISIFTTERVLTPIAPKIRKPKSKDTAPEVLDVLAYLNLKIGSKYSVAPDLVARFKQGASVDQAKAIIDKKVAEWAGTEMAPWLKPSTLFCKKHFDEYLNQPGMSAVKSAIRIPIWTEEQDAKHKEHARRWINDDSTKEEAR